MEVVRSFSTRKAAELAGLTPAMVNYLCRTGLVKPSGHGKIKTGRGRKRKYTFQDILLLRSYSELLKRGVSVKRIRDAYRTWSNLLRKESVLDMRYIVCNGDEIYFRREKNEIISLIDGQLTFAFILDIDYIRGEINRKINSTN